jgi:hypothetical protein
MIAIIRRWLSPRPPRPRHTWAPTGIVQKFVGHDQSKAEAVHAREQAEAAARRARAALYAAVSRRAGQ